MASYPDGVDPGQFLPTTQVYDLEKSEDSFEDFAVRIRNNLNAIVLSLNARDSGYYSLEETVNGQLYFPDYSQVNPATNAPATYRQVYRKVIDCGALPNNATKNIPHGINISSEYRFTRIYGCATRPDTQYAIPLPFLDITVLANGIKLYVSPSNVVIQTRTDRSPFIGNVVLEYIKQ